LKLVCLAGAPLKPATALHHRALKSASDLPVEVAKAVGVAVAEAIVDRPIVIADAAVRGAGVLLVATANAATVHRHPDPEVVIETIDPAAHRRLATMIPATIATHRQVIGMVRTVEVTVRPHRARLTEEVRIPTTAALPLVVVEVVEVVAVTAAVMAVAMTVLHRRVVAVAVAGLLPGVAETSVCAGTKDRLV
jgi:hypothetical protein